SVSLWIGSVRLVGRLSLWSTAVERHAPAEGGRRPARPAPAGRARGSGPAGSELQATLAGGVGQGLDAAVVPVARAVEGDLLDAGGLGALGDDLADLGRGLDVLAVLQAFLDVGLQGVGGGDHLGAVGGEQLGVQVLAGTQDRQARHAELADVGAGGLGAAQAGVVLDAHGFCPRKRIGLGGSPVAPAGPARGEAALRLLGFLANDDFVGILHALAL